MTTFDHGRQGDGPVSKSGAEGSTPSRGALRYALRLGRPSDLPYVVDTWIKKGRNPDESLSAATARVRAILAHHDSMLRVACLSDDDDAILGWAAIDIGRGPPGLHYVYVRKDARKQGIAKSLLAGVDIKGLLGKTSV